MTRVRFFPALAPVPYVYRRKALSADASVVRQFSNPWLVQHVTVNDRCTENTTCAWLWTDASWVGIEGPCDWGPGSAVIHNWLDDAILSPWVSLASTPTCQAASARRPAPTRPARTSPRI